MFQTNNPQFLEFINWLDLQISNIDEGSSIEYSELVLAGLKRYKVTEWKINDTIKRFYVQTNKVSLVNGVLTKLASKDAITILESSVGSSHSFGVKKYRVMR